IGSSTRASGCSRSRSGSSGADPDFCGGHYLQQLVAQLLSQHGSQAIRLWNRRFVQLCLQHVSQLLQQLVLHAGAHVVGQAGAHVSLHGTLRQRFTHTSFSTHTLTFLHTVTGTHSVTVYGTLQQTCCGTILQTLYATCLLTHTVSIRQVRTGTFLTHS